ATRPTGAVTIQIDAELPLQLSTDGGRTYGTNRTVTLASTTSHRVLVSARDDGSVGPSQQIALITHTVINTLDPQHYPLDAIILPVTVTVLDTNVVLLSEVKVNPPGSQDNHFEFVEIKGPHSKMLT